MTDSQDIDRAKIPHKSSKKSRVSDPPLYKHLTNASHICTIAITLFIVYLCFSNEFVFFTWHPFLLSIGWMCTMTEGILILSRNNGIADCFSHIWQVRLHWILQAVAILCTSVGFIIVVVNKDNLNKVHWKSWHGLMGLISVVFAVIPTVITGIPALYCGELRKYISSRLNQLIHSIFGIATLIFGSITMILSLYTKWFARRTEGSSIIFGISFVVMIVPLIWTWFSPIRKAIQRTKAVLTARRAVNN